MLYSYKMISMPGRFLLLQSSSKEGFLTKRGAIVKVMSGLCCVNLQY